MIELSIEQIRAAQANDLDATTAVIQAMDERIGYLATRYASKGGHLDAAAAEDMAQVGRITCWQSISAFRGTTVAEFFAFMDRAISSAISDEREVSNSHGVSTEAARRFADALSVCAGDPYEAERYASSEAIDSKRRLSKDNALAARLAWQGLEHLDAPAPSGESATLGERLADSAVPDDLVEPSDRERERRAAIREAVHATLGRLGAQSAYVLRATYGITPVPFFGSTGDGDEELAAALGSTPAKIRVVRSKAKARFRDLYLAGAAELVALPAAA